MIYSSQIHGGASPKETEYLEGWQRERAKLDNFRKRMEHEQALYTQRAKAQAAASLLTLADNFQAVVKHVPSALEKESWTQGVLHVARQLEQLLQEHGIAPIIETGIPFNPAFHEAIEEVKDEATKSGFVLEIIQPGYTLGDSVLKPARVKVSA